MEIVNRSTTEDLAPQYYDGNRARRYMGLEEVTPA